MTPDFEFSKAVFAIFAMIPLVMMRVNQKVLIAIFFLYFVLREFPLEVFALWFVVISSVLVLLDMFNIFGVTNG
ncbi:MAG TPA: hypothetical protein VFD70_24480 [Anaerolineae bacterium]|nr:hypothetical protein [Anaerolineae bacterium]